MRVVEAAGELAEVLAAAPRVDVGAAGLVGAGAGRAVAAAGRPPAGPAGRGSRSRPGRCRGPARPRCQVPAQPTCRFASGGRPSREANRNRGPRSKRWARQCDVGRQCERLARPVRTRGACLRWSVEWPRWTDPRLFASPMRRDASVARRGRRGSRSRRSALHRVVPESRVRSAGSRAARWWRSRCAAGVFGEVVADMVEGVVIANGLEGLAGGAGPVACCSTPCTGTGVSPRRRSVAEGPGGGMADAGGLNPPVPSGT